MILHEWEGGDCPFSGEALKRFDGYLQGVWESRERYLDADEDAPEEKSGSQRFFDFSYDGRIKARNYVGVVQFEGKRLEVKPKLFNGRTEPVNWKFQLLYWLSYCRRIRFPFSFANLSMQDMEDFLELLIFIFAHFTEELLCAQPYQAYQLVEEETVYLKGRLVFDAYTRNNLITGRWQHFTCQHQPFVFDNQFNRIVKYVSRRLLLVSRHSPNRAKLEDILFLLDEVTDCSCVAGDCDRVQLNGLYADHQHILSLCKMYLSNQMIDTSEDESSNFCFLVPMEYVFEDFVFGFLKAHFPKYDLRWQSQGHLATRDGEPVFGIKNDIYMPGKLVMDTKYTFRPKDDKLQAGVGQSHMYQMLAYALRRQCDKVVLIYPYLRGAVTEQAVFQIGSELLKREVVIEAVTVDIIVPEMKMTEEVMRERLRQALFANTLNDPSFGS